jgi:oligopeptide/dipeptide ABC transporter ATP-binding protein
MSAQPLLVVSQLTKEFAVRKGLFSRTRFLNAVDDVSFQIAGGETLGLVGESGCGKSTLGRLILRLIEPSFGQVHLSGVNITDLQERELRPLRRNMQMVFQDPHSSLNPRLTVERIVGEPLKVHKLTKDERELREKVSQLLDRVGLPAHVIDRYPHEFSGGQRQRIGIARALAAQPRFIVCDEPTSALDVSIQAQIVNLLTDLQQQEGLAYLFISHDLSVVQAVSHRVAVMYLGRLVELAPTELLFSRARHPYTRALLNAAPIPDPNKRRLRLVVEGEPPSPLEPPPGCAFHPRCPRAIAGRCDTETPQLLADAGHANAGPPSHLVSCFNPHE